MKLDYIYRKKLFSLEEVKKINRIIKKNYDSSATDVPAKERIKTAEVKGVPFEPLKKELKSLIDVIKISNQRFFGFDLYEVLDNQLLNWNIYKKTNEVGYDWHCDRSQDHASDIKLTVILNLSEKKHEGGQFYLNECGVINEISEAGDVLIFKAFMPHKVDKITYGERTTLSFWLEGPCFK